MGYRPAPPPRPRQWELEKERRQTLALLTAEKSKIKRKREPVVVHGDDEHAALILREDVSEAMIFLPPPDAIEVNYDD